MHVPPHALPDVLDGAGVGSQEERHQVPVDQVVNGGAADIADAVGIAHAFVPALAGETNGHESEVGHVAVGGVGQDDRQWNSEMIDRDVLYSHVRHKLVSTADGMQ